MKKITLLMSMIMVVLFTGITQAAVPHLINYQAKLTDSDGKALTGSYSITFRIYDAESAGNLLCFQSFPW